MLAIGRVIKKAGFGITRCAPHSIQKLRYRTSTPSSARPSQARPQIEHTAPAPDRMTPRQPRAAMAPRRTFPPQPARCPHATRPSPLRPRLSSAGRCPSVGVQVSPGAAGPGREAPPASDGIALPSASPRRPGSHHKKGETGNLERVLH